VTRTLLAILGSSLVLGLVAGPAVPAGQPPQASGGAFALKVIVPGQAGASVAEIGGPASTTSGAGGFAYPADGSVARIGPAATSLTVTSGPAPTVQAGADISAISLFNGEITVDGMTIRAAAGIRAEGATAGGEGSTVRNVLALGQAVPGSPGASAALADWGTVTVLPASAERTSTAPTFKGHANVVGLHVVLTQPHGGLPAGSEILVGYADASAQASPPAAPPPTTSPTTTSAQPDAKPPQRTVIDAARAAAKALSGNRAQRSGDEPPEQRGGADGAPGPPVFRELPTGVNAELTPGRYVFPVYGTVAFSNTFGSARASTGWHHGEDIFGQLGEPILAVADGTIFSVGWNNVGGFRLWLRDRAGNQFYYAHLSAYSPLAANGREVRAGQVIAFMGNTGEARTTPVHLHFEIHPVSMLQFGYDGAIAPYPYLLAWQRLEDVSFAFGSSWVPLLSVTAAAPKPGAILLSSQDISSASGLDPASLRRALAAPVGGEGGGAGLLQG
jgi:murein DD-endopeptidase MepM/ murein hydrolase activator NlpD